MFDYYFRALIISSALLFPTAQPGLLSHCFKCLKGSPQHILEPVLSEAQLNANKLPIPEIPNCDMSLYTDVKDLTTGKDGIVRLYQKAPQEEGQSPEYFVWKKIANVSEFVDIQLEMKILARLNNSNVTPHIICRSNDSFIMERIPGISLFSALNQSQHRLTLDSFQDLSIRMIQVLAAVHNYGVLHLDLHLENWFIDVSSRKIWLIDFSRGRFVEKHGYLQVPSFGRAAEVSRKGFSIYGPKTDVYELGCALYSMYFHFTEDYREDDEVCALFDKMTVRNPHERPFLEKVEELLSNAIREKKSRK